MNINEPIHSTLDDNENERQGESPLEDRNNRYDKLNLKYYVIAFLFILFSLINLSFYFIDSFSFLEENYSSNNNEKEGI